MKGVSRPAEMPGFFRPRASPGPRVRPREKSGARGEMRYELPRNRAMNLLPKIFGRRLGWFGIRCCRRLLPRTLWADWLVALLEFLLCHKRLPERNAKMWSTHMFAIRTSGVLYDPLRQFVTDKEYVKLYIAATVGSRYNIRTFRILRTKEDVDALELDRFPCVFKPTSGSGMVYICTGPTDLPPRDTLQQWLDFDFYAESREQNYRYLRQKIIVEEFFSENGRTPATSYRIHCFHGRPGVVQVDSSRPGVVQVDSSDVVILTRTAYDLNWNELPVSEVPFPRRRYPKPPMLDEMLDLAALLSAPFDYIRVDLYATKTDLRVGELTNCPNRAIRVLSPPEAQYLLGRFFEQPQDG